MVFTIKVSLVIALGLLLSACGGGGSGDEADSSGGTAVATVGTVNAPDGARLLAAQCFQCHGTDGLSSTGIENLNGEKESELVEEMLKMKNSSTTDDIMHHQAKGYTEEQIRAIAKYIAALPRANKPTTGGAQ